MNGRLVMGRKHGPDPFVLDFAVLLFGPASILAIAKTGSTMNKGACNVSRVPQSSLPRENQQYCEFCHVQHEGVRSMFSAHYKHRSLYFPFWQWPEFEAGPTGEHRNSITASLR